jgi:hypothetical protein
MMRTIKRRSTQTQRRTTGCSLGEHKSQRLVKGRMRGEEGWGGEGRRPTYRIGVQFLSVTT